MIYNNELDDYSGYEWEDEPREKQLNIRYSPDIYKLDYKQFQCLIYNQLEEIFSLLNSIKEVVINRR